MKKRNFLQQVQHWADCWIESTTNRFSPIARVVFVLILGSALLLYSLFFIGYSMYNLGTRNARIELMQQYDNSNTLNFEEYEYK